MNKIALTVGDPSGVGPEIIEAFARENPSYADEICVIAPRFLTGRLPSAFESAEVGPASLKVEPGRPSQDGARAAFEALEKAADGCKKGLYSAVVTAPVSKANMRTVGFNFPGQTEFFESRWGGRAVMSFAGEKLLLSLVTWHIPLSEVSSSINFENFSAAVESACFLARKMRGIGNPRIAVCGVNPHAGEGGIMGFEERDLIDPWVDSLREKYPNLSHALPPDTVFMRALRGEFDSIVSMYHDQGLAPLKALEFDKAVNVSLGLRHIRTSPDHGTGFDIAGKSIASYSSLKSAVDCALKLIC